MINNEEQLATFISKMVRYYNLCESYTSRLRIELLRELSFDGRLDSFQIETIIRKQRRIHHEVKYFTKE